MSSVHSPKFSPYIPFSLNWSSGSVVYNQEPWLIQPPFPKVSLKRSLSPGGSFCEDCGTTPGLPQISFWRSPHLLQFSELEDLGAKGWTRQAYEAWEWAAIKGTGRTGKWPCIPGHETLDNVLWMLSLICRDHIELPAAPVPPASAFRTKSGNSSPAGSIPYKQGCVYPSVPAWQSAKGSQGEPCFTASVSPNTAEQKSLNSWKGKYRSPSDA